MEGPELQFYLLSTMKLLKARHIFFNNLFSLVFSTLRILLNKSANPFAGKAASSSVYISSFWNTCRSPHPGHMQVVRSSSLWFCCGSSFSLFLFLLSLGDHCRLQRLCRSSPHCFKSLVAQYFAVWRCPVWVASSLLMVIWTDVVLSHRPVPQ